MSPASSRSFISEGFSTTSSSRREAGLLLARENFCSMVTARSSGVGATLVCSARGMVDGVGAGGGRAVVLCWGGGEGDLVRLARAGREARKRGTAGMPATPLHQGEWGQGGGGRVCACVCVRVPEVVVVVVCMRGAVERQGRPARVPWSCQGSRKVDEQPAAHCCQRSDAKGGMPGAAQEYRACVA